MAERRFNYRLSVLLLLIVAASCSGGVNASGARQKADAYLRTQFNVRDLRALNVATTENATDWIVTYSAKRQAAGGPLVIGVDKKTGGARLIEGNQ